MPVALNDEIRLAVLTYIEENRKTTWITFKLNVSERQIKRMKRNFRLYASMVFSVMRKNRFKIVDEVMKKAFFD